jgi:hypothetical protein
MANLVMPYLIKVEVHVTEEIHEQDYPSNLQANKKCVNVCSAGEKKGTFQHKIKSVAWDAPRRFQHKIGISHLNWDGVNRIKYLLPQKGKGRTF